MLSRQNSRAPVCAWLPAVLAVFALGFLGCGSETDAPPLDPADPPGEHIDPADPADPAAPESGSGIVVYERDGDVWLRRLGEAQDRRLAVGARYPRLAPDGRRVACISGSRVIVVAVADGSARVAFEGTAPRCADFSKDGAVLLVSDNQAIWRVRETGGPPERLFGGLDAFEIDAGPSGDRAVATVRGGTGFEIIALEASTRTRRRLTAGCSAALSPDAERVLSNPSSHRETIIHRWSDGSVVQRVPSPDGVRIDNHAWSNADDWIVAMREADGAIFALDLARATWHQLTPPEANDRPDLWFD